MTLGEKLLNLSAEYQKSTASRESGDAYGGVPAGREPAVIAAEYEASIRELLLAG